MNFADGYSIPPNIHLIDLQFHSNYRSVKHEIHAGIEI